MGTGFHPDPSTQLRTRLTGRENRVNGATLCVGMRRAETCAELSRSIAAKFHEIVAFAETPS